ncbi:MAG: hypothetical protein AB1631_05740, partial [Acidobacteriota bacterium]
VEEKATQETRGIRRWLAGFFSAPRLSLVATAALVLLAIGATITVMSYLNSRNQQSDPSIGSQATNNQSPDSDKQSDNTQKDDAVPKDVPPTASNEGGTLAKVSNKPPRKEAARKPTPEQLVREAEQKYIAAIALLSKEVNRRRTEIDPAVLTRFDSALAAIDRTIEDTRRAVRQSPNDPIALQYMLAAYAKKVDVLREMAND